MKKKSINVINGKCIWKNLGGIIKEALKLSRSITVLVIYPTVRYIIGIMGLIVTLIVTLILLPILFLFHFSEFLPSINQFFPPEFLLFIGLLISLGVFPLLIPKKIKDILNSLSNIKKKSIKVINGEDIRRNIKKIIEETLKLYPSITVLVIVIALAYSWQKNEKENWEKVDTIESKVDSLARSDEQWRKIVGSDLDNIKTDTANLIILRSSGHSPAYLSGQDTLSLVYRPQGKLKNKRGICPEGDNLAWLQLFKQAIWKCSERQKMELQVRGFASIAPVTEKGQSEILQDKSNSLNVRIANQRAQAVFHFLADSLNSKYDREKCQKALVDPDSMGTTTRNITTGDPDSMGTGPNFNVTYTPWKDPGSMKNNKPAQDSLRLDLEFLNRTVQIIIEEGNCWSVENNDGEKK